MFISSEFKSPAKLDFSTTTNGAFSKSLSSKIWKSPSASVPSSIKQAYRELTMPIDTSIADKEKYWNPRTSIKRF